MLALLLLLAAAPPAGPRTFDLTAPPAPAGPPPPEDTLLRADGFTMMMTLGVLDGEVGGLQNAQGTPLGDSLTLRVLHLPEGWTDEAWRCSLRLPALQAKALDTAAWPELWPGAAWQVVPGEAASVTGPCDRFEPERFEGDLAAAWLGAGWNVGLGPLLPSLAFACGEEPGPGATVYVWMDGARPLPIAIARAEAVDATGTLTGEPVEAASAATILPSGRYTARCAVLLGT